MDGPDFHDAVPDNGLHFESHSTLWALWSAPLLVSTDIRAMGKDKSTILKNKEVIAINQDALPTAGDRILSSLARAAPSSVGARFGERGQIVVLYNSRGTSRVWWRRKTWELAAPSRSAWRGRCWVGCGRPRRPRLMGDVHARKLHESFNASLKARDVQMLRVTRLG